MKTFLLLLAVLSFFTLTTTSATAEEGWFKLNESLSKADYVDHVVVSVIKGQSVTLSRISWEGKMRFEFITEVEIGTIVFFKTGPHTVSIHVTDIDFEGRRVKIDVKIDPDLGANN